MQPGGSWWGEISIKSSRPVLCQIWSDLYLCLCFAPQNVQHGSGLFTNPDISVRFSLFFALANLPFDLFFLKYTKNSLCSEEGFARTSRGSAHVSRKSDPQGPFFPSSFLKDILELLVFFGVLEEPSVYIYIFLKY